MLYIPLVCACKDLKTISFFLLTFILFPVKVLSDITVPEEPNTPYYQSFDSDNYQNILRVYTGNIPSNTKGCVHEWVSNGGWQGSGGAKFYQPTEDQAYCGFGQFFLDYNNGNGAEQINVRFLIYHGSEYYQRPKENKLLILNRDELRQRPMIGENWYEDGSWNSIFRAYAPCDNTTCMYDGGQSWPESNERFTIGPKPEHISEEWVSVELEANVTTGIIRLYIDTRDGAFSGLYKEMTFQESPLGTPLFTFIDMIGGYFNFGSPSKPDNYQIFDELKIDDSYIGPPAGFVNTPNHLTTETFIKTYQTKWQTVDLSEQFVGTSILLSQMQSFNGSDTAATRIRNLTRSTVDLLIEEEQSFDTELGHTNEVVGLLGVSEGEIVDQSGHVVGEVGLITANSNNGSDWRTLTFSRTYSDPILLMEMNTFNGGQPAHIRLRSISSTNAQYHIEEWDYLDGSHTSERIGYIIVERGTHLLNDGNTIQAGSVAANHTWLGINFQDMSEAPVVFSQSQTYNGGQAVVTRQRNITSNGFQMRLQEEEANDGHHAVETVGYLIIR